MMLPSSMSSERWCTPDGKYACVWMVCDAPAASDRPDRMLTGAPPSTRSTFEQRRAGVRVPMFTIV